MIHTVLRLPGTWAATLTCALVLLYPVQGHATQWKWVDAQGKVQYSDRPPPPSVPQKSILKQPKALGVSAGQDVRKPATAAQAASASQAAGLPSVDPELEKKKREQEMAQEQERQAQASKRAQQRAENCQKARKYDRALEQGYRVGRANDKGEREFLDDKAIAEERANARRVMASECD